jgi:hypothetical protein
MTYVDRHLVRLWRSRYRPLVYLSVVAILVLSTVSAHAQTTQLTTGTLPGAISCVPSTNGTGHMVCAEYTNTGAVVGVSWQAPGTFKFYLDPKNANLVEPSGTIDSLALGVPAGSLVGAPGCASSNNNLGSITCLVIVGTSTAYQIQGVAFNPAAKPSFSSGLVNLGSVPLPASVSNPSCTAATNNFAGATPNFQVICAIVINSQLFGIGFNFATTGAMTLTLNTGLQPLPLGTGFSGNPGCTSAGGSGIGVCAVRNAGGTGLLGFTFDTSTGNTAPVTAASITTVSSRQLLGSAVSGNPSCATPGGGATRATCGIVDGNTLLGISFDSVAQNDTGFRSLGAASDSGVWNGQIGCGRVNDTDRVNNGRQNNVNLISCAVVSSTSNVFEITFDPQPNPTRILGLNGPFPVEASGAPSCLELAIDKDKMYCGNTTTAGASVASVFGIGLAQPSQANAFRSILDQ